jgi:hypothetical protein
MEQSVPSPKREITINSDWITTIVMALLLVVCSLLLIWDIRGLVSGSIVEQAPFARDLFTNIFTIIAAVYCFLAVRGFHAMFVRIGFALMGIQLASGVVLGYFRTSTDLQHNAAVAGSLVRQVAFTIFVVAIVQWFKSVVHRNRISDTGVADS